MPGFGIVQGMTTNESLDRDALAHFAAKLAHETDVSDVHAALTLPDPGFVLVDSRSREAWDRGHIPGAIHLPTGEIAARAAELVPVGSHVVTYCWGPACNGATRAALEFARLGHRVREMIGGFEYWVREGFAYDTAGGAAGLPAPDPLTTVVESASCGC